MRQVHRLKRQILLYLSVTLLSLGATQAYDPTEYESQQNEIPKELEGVGIEEKLGTDLSKLQIKLVDSAGNTKPLGAWLNKERPVILSLVYFSCPSLCNLHLNGVLDALKQLSLKAGQDYDLLAVSFDPKETPELAAAKKYTYLESYKIPQAGDGVHFLTGDENSLKILADSIGFKYKWDAKSKEWAHASAAVILTPEGVVSRYLHGVYIEPKTFRLSLVEASKGLVGDIIDSVVLFCFRYDPKANKYALYAYNLVRAGAAVAVVLVLIWLVPFWLRDRRHKRR